MIERTESDKHQLCMKCHVCFYDCPCHRSEEDERLRRPLYLKDMETGQVLFMANPYQRINLVPPRPNQDEPVLGRETLPDGGKLPFTLGVTYDRGKEACKNDNHHQPNNKIIAIPGSDTLNQGDIDEIHSNLKDFDWFIYSYSAPRDPKRYGERLGIWKNRKGYNYIYLFHIYGYSPISDLIEEDSESIYYSYISEIILELSDYYNREYGNKLIEFIRSMEGKEASNSEELGSQNLPS